MNPAAQLTKATSARSMPTETMRRRAMLRRDTEIRLHLVLLQWSIGANFGIFGCTAWLRLGDDLRG